MVKKMINVQAEKKFGIITQRIAHRLNWSWSGMFVSLSV